MCLTAREVQVDHKWAEGDWFWDGAQVKCIGSDLFGVVEYAERPLSEVRVPLLPRLTAMELDPQDRVTVPDFDVLTFQRFEYGRVTWLPRQDQLQTMVNGAAISARELGWWFGNWCDRDGDPSVGMDELWLSYVMHEKYGKRWNGDNWISEKKGDER